MPPRDGGDMKGCFYFLIGFIILNISTFAQALDVNLSRATGAALPRPIVRDLEANPLLANVAIDNLLTPANQASQVGQPSVARVVVLVPGFFSSIVPMFQKQYSFVVSPYWSDTIVSLFQSAGYTVFVVGGLNPIGSIEDNGKRLLAYLNSVQKYYQNRQQAAEYYLVGHSSGGLYSLYALSEYARMKSSMARSVKKIITISTPFGGASVLDDFYTELSFVGDFIKWISLQSIKELSQVKVQNFLSSVRVPSDLQLISFPSFQEGNPDWADAHYRSFPFYLSGMFIKNFSDGLISFQSSLSATNRVITVDNHILPVQTFPQEYIHLDHGKQVLDFRAFRVLAVNNVEVIRDEQIRFYNRVINIIK